MMLPSRSTAGPIVALAAAPHVGLAIAVVHVDAAAGIIIVAVPAERVVAVAAIIAVTETAVITAAVADADRDAGRGPVAVTVRASVHVVGTAAEGQRARGQKGNIGDTHNTPASIEGYSGVRTSCCRQRSCGPSQEGGPLPSGGGSYDVVLAGDALPRFR